MLKDLDRILANIFASPGFARSLFIVGMYGYTVPDPGPYTYKCVYSGGKEIRITSDQSSATFVKCEKKSPDLKEVWKLIKSEDDEDWEKIYPEPKSKYGYY